MKILAYLKQFSVVNYLSLQEDFVGYLSGSVTTFLQTGYELSTRMRASSILVLFVTFRDNTEDTKQTNKKTLGFSDGKVLQRKFYKDRIYEYIWGWP